MGYLLYLLFLKYVFKRSVGCLKVSATDRCWKIKSDPDLLFHNPVLSSNIHVIVFTFNRQEEERRRREEEMLRKREMEEQMRRQREENYRMGGFMDVS